MKAQSSNARLCSEETMRKRLVHRVATMIGFYHRGDITLLTEEDFTKWREILMPDLTTLQSAEFAMGVAMNTGRDGPLLRLWERKFCKRLGFVDWVGLREKDYEFLGEDARWHIDAFLEAYRLKHDHNVLTRHARRCYRRLTVLLP